MGLEVSTNAAATMQWNRRIELAEVGALLVLIGIVFVAVAANFIELRHDSIWIDPVTASMKYETRTAASRRVRKIERSALEDWIVQHEGGYANQWQFVSEKGFNGYGRPMSRGCGSAPPIYHLYRSAEDFVRSASDEQIAEFLLVMRAGSEPEQEKAIQTAIDIIYGDIPGRRQLSQEEADP